MKSPLFLCIFLVALSLCASSLFFAYARSATPAGSSPSDAQDAQTSEVVMPGSSFEVVIPGPLRSFLRMAGISQKVSSEEVLPLLARNEKLSSSTTTLPTLITLREHDEVHLLTLIDTREGVKISRQPALIY